VLFVLAHLMACKGCSINSLTALFFPNHIGKKPPVYELYVSVWPCNN